MTRKILCAAMFALMVSACAAPDEDPAADASASDVESEAVDSTSNESTDDAAADAAGEQVEPQDASLENSPISMDENIVADWTVKRTRKSCMWNGKEYSDGGVVCERSRSYRCWDGRWMSGNYC